MTNLRWRVPGFGGDAEKFAALAQKEVIGHAGEAIALFLEREQPNEYGCPGPELGVLPDATIHTA
jgi:hypothetical protein